MADQPASASAAAESPMQRVHDALAAKDPILFVPGSTARADFDRCVRAVKAKMAAFARGPLFLYPARAQAAERLAQVRELEAELASYEIPAEAAYLMRTSGSTSGTGKIVVLSTAALTASAKATQAALGGPSRWVTCLPTAHVAGFQTVFRSLLAGREPIWGGRGRPEEIVAAVKDLAPGETASISLVPTQLVRLLEAGPEALRTLSRFSTILVGGAALSPELHERAEACGLALVRTYGMTETCGGCVYDGIPIGDTRVEIEADGRIVLSGSCLALGYAGGEPFAGRFPTSDAGRLVPDCPAGPGATGAAGKRLEVLGRLDGAITSGGVTVIPEVVEAELERAGCGPSVVVAAADATWGERVLALASLPVPDIRERLKARLEPGWTPAHVFFLGDLGLAGIPMLDSGKPDRAAVAGLLARAEAARA